MNKVHYKMFKAGKKWMVAGLVTVAMSTGAFFVTSINANADVVANAAGYVGTPYSYGGTDASGLDCSGLVQSAYAADGINLPRTSGAQYGVTTQESAAEAQPGDLIFFGSNHVGIYTGNGTMIDAETDGVKHQSVALMESAMGQASYGRVNGAARAAFDNSAATAPAATTDTTPVAQTDATAPAATTDTTPVAQTDATAPAATTDTTPVAQTDATAPAATTDTTPVAQTDATAPAATTDTTPVAQTDATAPAATTDTTPVAQTDATAPAATTDTTPVAQTDANEVTTVQNDNVVTLDKAATSVPQSNTAASTSDPATTTSNKKAALPATGESNNSFLSVIGLVLVSLVAMFGIKLRKNN